MRTVRTCLVLMAVFAMTGTAGALTLQNYSPPGLLVFDIFDYTAGALYGSGSAIGETNVDALESQPCPAGVGREDLWGIGHCVQITNEDGTIVHWSSASTGDELTFLFYGGVDIELEHTGPEQTTWGTELKIKVFEDTTPDYDPTGGPSVRGGVDQYPTVTDGTCIVEMAGEPLIPTPGGQFAEHTNTLNTGTFTGGGNMYASVADVDGDSDVGTMGEYFDQDMQWNLAAPWLGTCDFEIRFTATPGNYGWTTRSHDPMEANFVPEPITMLGAFLGIGSLGAYLRRRRLA